MLRAGVLGKILSLSFSFYICKIGDSNCMSWSGVVEGVSDVNPGGRWQGSGRLKTSPRLQGG